MIDKVTVKIINKSNNDLPQYSTPSAAGMDLRANLSEAVTLSPLERKLSPQAYSSNCRKAMSARYVHAAGWL